MGDVKINGRIKVKSFYNSFIKEFPYLHAGLRNGEGKGADLDVTIANLRVSSTGKYSGATGDQELSAHGNLQVESFEKRFQDALGIKCQIHYKSKAGKWTPASKIAKMSLNEANAWVKDQGGQKLTAF